MRTPAAIQSQSRWERSVLAALGLALIASIGIAVVHENIPHDFGKGENTDYRTPFGDKWLVVSDMRTIGAREICTTVWPDPPEPEQWRDLSRFPAGAILPIREDGSIAITCFYGWPCWCLTSGDVYVRGGGSNANAPFQSYGTQFTICGRDMYVPTRIVWPGLALNTLLLSPASLLALRPGWLRAWSRKRRGHCPACGYDLSGIPAGTKCPECGTTPSGA